MTDAEGVGARSLILETSCMVGQVALARGTEVLAVRRLDEARRHARDLIPALGELLQEQGWKPHDLDVVIVSRGPGSYTGLRVGLMTAKTLAYALGCTLLGVETMAAIALQSPADAQRVHVLVDAQQDKVYVQTFGRVSPQAWQALTALSIQPFADWLSRAESAAWLSGPGIRGKEDRLDQRLLVDAAAREPRPESLLVLGLERHARGERDDVFALEPLYLRPSAAEEKLR